MKTIFDTINNEFFKVQESDKKEFIESISRRSFEIFEKQYPDDTIIKKYKDILKRNDKKEIKKYKNDLYDLAISNIRTSHKIYAGSFDRAYAASYSIYTIFEIMEWILTQDYNISRVIENYIFAECYNAASEKDFSESTYIKKNGMNNMLEKLKIYQRRI